MTSTGHMPSPLEHMIGTMNEDRKNTGMSCQIKRRLPDGSLQDADPRALDARVSGELRRTMIHT